MIQLCVASTLYGTATLAAAVDAGLRGTPERRVLVISNNAEAPEAQPGPQAQPGFAELAGRFDAVVSWNDVVYPFHPTQWRPRASDATLWERLVRQAWQLVACRLKMHQACAARCIWLICATPMATRFACCIAHPRPDLAPCGWPQALGPST